MRNTVNKIIVKNLESKKRPLSCILPIKWKLQAFKSGFPFFWIHLTVLIALFYPLSCFIRWLLFLSFLISFETHCALTLTHFVHLFPFVLSSLSLFSSPFLLSFLHFSLFLLQLLDFSCFVAFSLSAGCVYVREKGKPHACSARWHLLRCLHFYTSTYVSITVWMVVTALCRHFSTSCSSFLCPFHYTQA